jgi:branched-chain amino acid transport system substrate-binding protein
VVCSCSGPFGANVVDAWKTLQAWDKWVNANGGISGHPVVLSEKDDQSNPGVAVSSATQLVASHPALIFDLSILDSAWAKTVDAAHIPVVGGNVSFPPSYQDPNFYSSAQTGDSAIYASELTAKTAGATNIGLMNCAEGCNVTIALQQSTAKALGLPVPYSGEFAATAPNFTAQCVAAKQAKVQALVLFGSIINIARVAADCNRQGYNPIYVAEGTGFTDQILTSVGLKDHMWEEFPILPYHSSNAAVQNMNTQLDKYFPGLRENAQDWSEFAAQAWTGGLLIQAAAKNAGLTASQTVTAADMTNGLNSIKNETLGGFSPSLTFEAGKPHPVDCWYTAKIQGGVVSLVGGQICHNVSS